MTPKHHGDEAGRSAAAAEPGAEADAATVSGQARLGATFSAARGFLFAEWVGAILMLASFTQLYAFGLQGAVRATITAGLAMMALGGFVYWRSRKYYESLDFPWKRGWHVAALVVAGSAIVFWLLFAVAVALVAGGVDVF